MTEIARILCPIDFSDYSRHAFECALAVARWYGSRITALHVCPRWPPVDIIPPIARRLTRSEDLDEEERAELTRSMFEFVAQSPGLEPVPVDVQIEVAPDVFREVLAQAEALRTDLIVMGSHGRSGFERLMLGSVSEKVLRKAACPVMIAPPRISDAALSPVVHFKHILCPVDFSSGSLAALAYALSIAAEADAHLTLVHVLEVPPELLVPPSREGINVDEVRAAAEAESLRRVRDLIPESVRPYCTVETVVVEGRASRQILRLAAERKIELIVMGVQGRGAMDLLTFGSNTHDVIRAASCPVLTIRVNAAAEARRVHDRTEDITLE